VLRTSIEREPGWSVETPRQGDRLTRPTGAQP
jgi:hypothetical protein